MMTHTVLPHSHFSTLIAPILREGDAGPAVKELQTLLNQKGARLAVDGVFGGETKRAIAQFQKQSNLIPDGTAGLFTWVALRKPASTPINLVNVCLLYDPYRYPHQTYAIKWLATQISNSVFREFLQRWDDVPVSPDLKLQVGNQGKVVQRLQGMLNSLGAEVPEDGSFCHATRTAVVKFQRHYGLSGNGNVDEPTWSKIRQVVERRYLGELFYGYQSRYKRQTAALEWLQKQLPSEILSEFATRWRNLNNQAA